MSNVFYFFAIGMLFLIWRRLGDILVGLGDKK